MFKLSPRMQLIYDHLIAGKPVWDFCCDHGYMGLSAYKSGRFPSVHFVDQVSHIIEQLEKTFEQEHRNEESDVAVQFVPSAAENLTMHVEGNVIIAGVGSFTISKILKGLIERNVLKAQRLILCPQDPFEKLMPSVNTLKELGYDLTSDPQKVKERGRMRSLLVFDKRA